MIDGKLNHLEMIHWLTNYSLLIEFLIDFIFIHRSLLAATKKHLYSGKCIKLCVFNQHLLGNQSILQQPGVFACFKSLKAIILNFREI